MKRFVAAALCLTGVFVFTAFIAQADLLEWKKMSFETRKPVAVLDSMADVRKVFASPLVCSGCHSRHYEEWNSSYHANSVNNAGFQALYLKYLEYLGADETRRALGRPAGPQELRQCLFCHAPMVQFASDRLVQKISDAISQGRWDEVREAQISCVVCHAIAPDGTWTGTFDLSGTMYGPLEDPAPRNISVHQSGFSSLHKDSAFCGICHSAKPFNVYCSLVYEQRQGAKGSAKHCQGCHMEEAAVRKSVAPGGTDRTAHSHLFPGGRSKDTMAKAFDLSLQAEKATPRELSVQVVLKNTIPHNIPDG